MLRKSEVIIFATPLHRSFQSKRTRVDISLSVRCQTRDYETDLSGGNMSLLNHRAHAHHHQSVISKDDANCECECNERALGGGGAHFAAKTGIRYFPKAATSALLCNRKNCGSCLIDTRYDTSRTALNMTTSTFQVNTISTGLRLQMRLRFLDCERGISGNILLNTIVDRRGHPMQHRLRRQNLEHNHSAFGGHDNTDLTDNNAVLGELLAHVRQLNEEIHQRHIGSDADEHYKSEWRMVALILDRILLIIFFIMTVFTCVVIFVNVPDQ